MLTWARGKFGCRKMFSSFTTLTHLRKISFIGQNRCDEPCQLCVFRHGTFWLTKKQRDAVIDILFMCNFIIDKIYISLVITFAEKQII